MVKKLLLIVSLCLALAPIRASASQVDFRLADGVRRTVLPNGLVVLVKPEPKATSVAIELLTRVGPAQEDNTTSGIATLVGRLLERRLSHPDGKRDDLLDRTGTFTHVNVALDYTELSVVTGPESYRPILDRLLSAYGKRPFDDEEINDEKGKLLKVLGNGEGDFNSVYDLFLALFYRYHPYRQPLGGDPVAVRRFTPPMVNAFIDRWYGPNRTILCVVGNVDPDLAERVATSSLGALRPVAENTETVTWEAASTEKEVPLVSEGQMAFLFLGFPAPSVHSQDYAAMQVLNSVMGTGVSSRLWIDLREQRGLAYELGSEYPTLTGPSHFLSFVITRPQQVRASRHRMFVEMDRIRREDVPQWELEAARWKAIGSVLAECETPEGQAARLATTEAQGVGYHFTDRYLDSLWHVTAADVRRVANQYLDNSTLLVARPPGTEPLLPDHL